jgi:hypothetical protein
MSEEALNLIKIPLKKFPSKCIDLGSSNSASDTNSEDEDENGTDGTLPLSSPTEEMMY